MRNVYPDSVGIVCTHDYICCHFRLKSSSIGSQRVLCQFRTYTTIMAGVGPIAPPMAAIAPAAPMAVAAPKGKAKAVAAPKGKAKAAAAPKGKAKAKAKAQARVRGVINAYHIAHRLRTTFMPPRWMRSLTRYGWHVALRSRSSVVAFRALPE